MRKSFSYLTENDENFSVGDTIQIEDHADHGTIAYDVIKAVKGTTLTCIYGFYDYTDDTDLTITKVDHSRRQRALDIEIETLRQNIKTHSPSDPLVTMSVMNGHIREIMKFLNKYSLK